MHLGVIFLWLDSYCMINNPLCFFTLRNLTHKWFWYLLMHFWVRFWWNTLKKERYFQAFRCTCCRHNKRQRRRARAAPLSAHCLFLQKCPKGRQCFSDIVTLFQFFSSVSILGKNCTQQWLSVITAPLERYSSLIGVHNSACFLDVLINRSTVCLLS